MSLDVYLRERVECPCCGNLVKSGEVLYSANITHNLRLMAQCCGLYLPLWCPEDIGVEQASSLVEPLEKGIAYLKAWPARCRSTSPANGWGTYEGLIDFAERYLAACKEHPHALVEVSR